MTKPKFDDEVPNDRQCRNFQTFRLSTFVPGPQAELDRAKAAVRLRSEQGVVGIVEAFPTSMQRLGERLGSIAPDFRCDDIRENARKDDAQSDTGGVIPLLHQMNGDDISLHRYVAQFFETSSLTA